MSLTAIRKSISRYDQKRWTRLNNPKILRQSLRDAVVVSTGDSVEVLIPLDLLKCREHYYCN